MTFSVLLVEDDELMRMLISESLEDSADITLYEAGSYREAQWWLDSSEVLDLVLLDNYLGDGEGSELLPFFTQQVEGSKAHCPRVMMLSANNDESFLSDCFERGASDYLIKPFNLGLLTLKVSALLREKGLQQALDRKNQQLQVLIARAEHEEYLARFTYDFIVKRATRPVPGVADRTVSSHAFSGDLILRATAPDGRAIIMVLDATGHGLSAAITLLPVVSTFQTMISKGFALQSVLLELNRHLLLDTPSDRFICCIALEMDPNRHEVAVWNGGMPPVLAVDANARELSRVTSTNMPLGVLSDTDFETATETYPLDFCHFWLAYSDGLYEQTNHDKAPLGRDRIHQHLRPTPEATIEALFMALAEHAGAEAYDDDVTVCSIDPHAFLASATGDSTPASETLPTASSKLDHGAFEWSLLLRARQLEDIVPPTLAMSLINELNLAQKLVERVFLVLTELVTNALDHGVLKLESELKQGENGFLVYAEERAKRLARLQHHDWVAISLSWDDIARKLWVCVSDSGAGFSPDTPSTDPAELSSGRGLVIVRQYVEDFCITPPGNRVNVSIPYPK
ncbi:SpoIIE family protein phosphatase [Salicola sp. Rm-C-2C1-2]|uniref:SpoIIE family protein phosphatase n=1 Tax=Salicola sp. Rm-C-2C1-2 TaxID=3141321 RepID=UPI0032E375DF